MRVQSMLLAVMMLVPHVVAAQQPVAITNVTIISMADTIAVPARTIIVQNGRITQIGPNSVRVPAGARVLDGAGKFLIPGLFDMHVHTSKTRASALGLYVVHGVTTVRDQGSEHAEVLRWRREVRAGTRVGPRMVIAGPYLESRNNIERMRRDPPESRVEPFERARIAVGTPEDARRIVDSLAGLELDHLKIRTVQDSATHVALGAAAKSRGLRLTGHVVGSPEALLEAGQSGIDHLFYSVQGLLGSSESRMPLWRELARRDVGVVPTLVTIPYSVLRPQAYFEALVRDTTAAVHLLRPYISKFMVLDWAEQVEEQSFARRTALQQVWPRALNQLREMRAAGVRIMAGSDVAVLNIFPGLSLHHELELFVDSVGMSNAEALARATRIPAEWLGLADSVGTVQQGKVADLVLLDANPLADISNTQRVAAVVLRGRLFDRRDLDALLADVRRMHDVRVNDWVR
jgi:imidazolonepropionase-like amidohydrolase